MRLVNLAAIPILGMVLFGGGPPPLRAPLLGRVAIAERTGTARDIDHTMIWLEAANLPRPAARRADIRMYDKTFIPDLVAVPVGSTVTFPNQDAFDHNVFSRSEAYAFDLGLYGHNESKSVTVNAPGIVRVYCNVHAKMSATIVAHETPYAVRADATGRFEFPDVPPGRYVLHAWHERGGQARLNVTLPVDTAVVVTLDARNYRFVQHLDKTGKRYDARGRRY